MYPEDIAKIIPLCDKCDRAQNPASSLAWFTTEAGFFCGNCYVPAEPPAHAPDPLLTVITCPGCLGTGCARCVNLGVVRVQLNAIAVWRSEPARLLES